jgi:ribosomal protein S18 acetylase RimI-like enzyme
VDISTTDSPFPVHGIADVAVLPEYRGQGIGSQLLELTVDEARRRGASAIMAATVARPVIHSLRKKGFREALTGEFYFNLGDHPGMEGRNDASGRPEWNVTPEGRVTNVDWWVWVDESLPDINRPIRIKQDF